MKKHLLLTGLLICGAALFAGCGQQGDVDKQPDSPAEIRETLNPIVRDVSKPVGIYTNALTYLYGQDEGLNDGIEMIAFDFGSCDNMTEEEETALMQYLSNEWDVPYVESDFEQLVSDGLIVLDENGFARFEKGLLITINIEGVTKGPESKEDFSFSAQKYRSSLGAYFLDCKAHFDGKEWSYQIESEAIS